jgi:hypothetical protein
LFQDCDPALIRDLVNFKLKLTIWINNLTN